MWHNQKNEKMDTEPDAHLTHRDGYFKSPIVIYKEGRRVTNLDTQNEQELLEEEESLEELKKSYVKSKAT